MILRATRIFRVFVEGKLEVCIRRHV
jgi:hypothetical protein